MFINQSFHIGYCDSFIHTPKLVREEVIFRVSLKQSETFPNKLEMTTHSRIVENKQVYVICISGGLNLQFHVTSDLELHNKIFSSLKIELENLNKLTSRLDAILYQEKIKTKLEYLYLGFEAIDLTLAGDSFIAYDHLEHVSLDARISANIVLQERDAIYGGMLEVNKEGIVDNRMLLPGVITDTFITCYKFFVDDFLQD